MSYLISKEDILDSIAEGDKYSVNNNKKALICYKKAMIDLKHNLNLSSEILEKYNYSREDFTPQNVFSQKSIESLKHTFKYGWGILSVEEYKLEAYEILEFINADYVAEAKKELIEEEIKRSEDYNEWLYKRKVKQEELKEKYLHEYGQRDDEIKKTAKNILVDGVVACMIARDAVFKVFKD